MTRMMHVMPVEKLHKQPQNTEVAKNDWIRVGKFLTGTWPKPQPEIREWTQGNTSYIWQDYLANPPEYFAIDTEYIPDSKKLLILGIGGPGLPVIQWYPSRPSAADVQIVQEYLKYWISRVPCVFQNCMADIPVIASALGIEYDDYLKIEDTMFLHSLLWCEMPHDLEFLARMYGDHEKMKHLPMTDPMYNAGDVAETLAVWKKLKREVASDPQTWWIYENSLLPLVPIILEAEDLGIRVDRQIALKAEKQYEEARQYAIEVAQAYCGFPINLGSPLQLKEMLQYEFPGKKIVSVDEDTIAKLRSMVLPFDPEEENTSDTLDRRLAEGAHPLLESRVLYARAQQYLSHYVRPMLDASSGRVHASFHPWAQNTGRWSTVRPALAQLPHSLRTALIPDIGWRWVEFDFDQIELRIIAALAGDKPLLEAFAKGYDPHLLNACEFFGMTKPPEPTKAMMSWAIEYMDFSVPPKEHRLLSKDEQETIAWVTRYAYQGSDDPRRLFAKPAVYRLCYGGTPRGAPSIPGAASTGLTAEQLIRASQNWINAHVAIKRFWSSIERTALRNRQLRTFLGRRWNFLGHDLKRIQRQMADFPMQGAVADIMNLTLIRIKETLGSSVRLSYTMHDSLKLQVRKTSAFDIEVATIKAIAESPWEINGLDISFPVEMHVR